MSGPSLQTRRTPRWFFDELDRRFGPFLLDAYASKRNALCRRYYTRRDNGHRAPWLDVTFANPPFAEMEETLAQALRQADLGNRSIVLGPAGGSQSWMHGLAIKGTVYLPDTRINFDTPDGRPTGQGGIGADRDTVVLGFGGEHVNPDWRRGIFRVRRLELGHVVPKKRRVA